MRKFLSYQQQESAKQKLYYSSKNRTVDINKVKELGIHMTHNIDRESNKIRVSLPDFYINDQKIPAKTWTMAVEFHFENYYLKGL